MNFSLYFQKVIQPGYGFILNEKIFCKSQTPQNMPKFGQQHAGSSNRTVPANALPYYGDNLFKKIEICKQEVLKGQQQFQTNKSSLLLFKNLSFISENFSVSSQYKAMGATKTIQENIQEGSIPAWMKVVFVTTLFRQKFHKYIS